MALDLPMIPPILADPKHIFSLTGLLLTANCTQLQLNIIGTSMAVELWDKEGIIDMVNRQLKRLQKEGTGHTQQEDDSTPCQDL